MIRTAINRVMVGGVPQRVLQVEAVVVGDARGTRDLQPRADPHRPDQPDRPVDLRISD